MRERLDEAWLSIDAVNGDIIDANSPAARLLGVELSQLQGQAWPRVIHCRKECELILAQALQLDGHVKIPSFVINLPGGRDTILAGLLSPCSVGATTARDLFLWELTGDTQFSLAAALSPGDTAAVLGLDRVSLDGAAATDEFVRLMSAMYASLRGILRKRDEVALPLASAIAIRLDQTLGEAAQDICLALLSHLRREHADAGFIAAGGRLSIGLANRSAGCSGVATLWAASTSLTLAQYSGEGEIIRFAGARDSALVGGRLASSGGIYASARSDDPPEVREAPLENPTASVSTAPPVAPIEKGIDGYVVDNMEGAVDQAIFLAGLDLPVAIIGEAGTGKMYVAQVIHDESGTAGEMLVSINCRDFRSRKAAQARIARELADAEGRTLVFKSPHLLHEDAQQKLARQIASRTLADVTPPTAMPRVKLIALFPESLEALLRRGELTQSLASAFAGYPIRVPPIRDRKQAVLRWAHKILGQEGALRDRDMKGFTPDAEQAMLQYDWPGNISEMRQCIQDALDKTPKDWLTPVDLGLFKGISVQGAPLVPETQPFLTAALAPESDETTYTPTALEAVHVALGEAVHSLLSLEMVKPLGAWAQDDIVLAALDRYRGDLPRAAEFLHTRARNISRWLPKIKDREEERNNSSVWQTPRRLLWEWVRVTAPPEVSPLSLVGDTVLAQLFEQAGSLSTASKARILGVSAPTYHKRLREVLAS
ncbi:sigma 54-interacting transcriptional regulator [Candidatus Marimicrobium litorale]|nr:sigma 54-interacting transcriptional regulator [Candidatus Marimicrobium litorale]